MIEKLYVTNFCGLRRVEIKFAPITLFIGPQATGKSVVAKAMFFFRSIAARLISSAEDHNSIEDYRATCAKHFCRSFPPQGWRGAGFSLRYESGGGWVEIQYEGGEIAPDGVGLRVELSHEYALPFMEGNVVLRALRAETAGEESGKAKTRLEAVRESIKGNLTNLLGPWANFEQFFIPAGRAFFAQFDSSVYAAIEEGGTIDLHMASFGRLFKQSQSVLEINGFFTVEKRSKNRWRDFRTAFATILGSQWVHEENHDLLVSSDGRKVRIPQSSSGQQEAFPLLLLLGRFWALKHTRGRAVYVEEPEAHLFPKTQRDLVGLLARTFRTREDQMRLIVTTHSPYVLSAFNNLLHAGSLYTNADAPRKRRLAKIIPENETLRPGELVAYALQNGGAKSIMDPGTGLVDAQIIDAVSTDLAKEFDRLLWEVG